MKIIPSIFFNRAIHFSFVIQVKYFYLYCCCIMTLSDFFIGLYIEYFMALLWLMLQIVLLWGDTGIFWLIWICSNYYFVIAKFHNIAILGRCSTYFIRNSGNLSIIQVNIHLIFIWRHQDITVYVYCAYKTAIHNNGK